MSAVLKPAPDLIEPGIYYGMPNAEYHARVEAIGNSGLKAMLRSPAYYFGQYRDPNCPAESERETPGRRFGNMVHCVLFEREAFDTRYKIGPVVTSKAVKAWKDFAATLDDGCTALDPREHACALKVRESVLAIPDMASALSVGQGEVSAFWSDPETGVLCKCRPDWVHPVGDDAVILIDGKSYASADEEEFARQVAKMDYHLQAALYTDGYQHASGKKVLGFIFLAIADEYPHLANPIMLDEDSMSVGRRMYRRALNTYAECERTGTWPGHGNDVKLISLPAWAKKD
jgi:hypothetical protein